MFFQFLDFFFKCRNSSSYMTSVTFKTRFTRTSCAYSRTCTAHFHTETAKSRQAVFKLCKFNLKFTLAAFCTHCENIKYKHRTVKHFYFKKITYISHLYRRKLIIKHNHIGIKRFYGNFEFIKFALAHIRCTFQISLVLNHFTHNNTACRFHQFAKLMY